MGGISVRATVAVELTNVQLEPRPGRTLVQFQHEGLTMSKGMDRKKEQRKKPAKTLEEKRAAKKTKREERSSNRSI